MKTIRHWLAASVLAGGALLTAAAGISIATATDDATTATPSPGPHGWHHHGPGHLFAQLGLSAEQQASIKTIMSSAGPQMKSLHQQMHANALKLRQTQPTDPNYTSVVADVSQANGALHTQMVTQQADVRAQVFNVLTPAQQVQLATLEAQMETHSRGAWGPRGAPPAQ